jgi:deoxycytidylate deaminase
MGDDPIDKLHRVDSELVIGLVGAVGTDLGRVGDLLENQLVRTGYEVRRVKISSDVIPHFGPIEYDGHDEFDRITKLMNAGNKARAMAKDNSVLALGAASTIAAMRSEGMPLYQKAFIIRSLKRPEEVERLRKIYPSGFVLLGVHAEEPRRIRELQDRGISLERAQQLVERDSNENIEKHGQRLEMTFYLSDFFVRLDGSEDILKSELRRLVELLFGHPFWTPSFDEYAMFFAFAAALRSADLSRQVGAVIAAGDQVLATGANDCPKKGGGLYWPIRDDIGCLSDSDGGRDYKRGFDSNKLEQKRIVDNIVDLGILRGIDGNILREILCSKRSPIRDLTEYGRVVHAEMDALMSCSRNGIRTAGTTLYCTTFPCHNCAKHIVAAGIKRVVYIEPYEKSKASEFHEDSIVFGTDGPDHGKVRFEPFMGIGPRRFFDLFSMNLSSGYEVIRKKETGENIDWSLEKARLRVQMLPSTYLDLEVEAANLFRQMAPGQGGQDGRKEDHTTGTE